MGFIEKIRNKPQQEKVRIIWLVVIVTAVLLIAIWVLTSRIGNGPSKDTSLFKTLDQGFKDIKENYKK